MVMGLEEGISMFKGLGQPPKLLELLCTKGYEKKGLLNT